MNKIRENGWCSRTQWKLQQLVQIECLFWTSLNLGSWKRDSAWSGGQKGKWVSKIWKYEKEL